MMVSVAGERKAAPRPCATRAPVSMPEVVARPPMRLAAENSTVPRMKIRRRPKMSAARPPSRRKPAKARM